eukprot:15365217-Ditylum_brightwellii.AAC.2
MQAYDKIYTYLTNQGIKHDFNIMANEASEAHEHHVLYTASMLGMWGPPWSITNVIAHAAKELFLSLQNPAPTAPSK